MSAAQKKVIDDHCTNEWAAKVAGPWADFEHGGIAKIKAEGGHEVYTLTPDQIAAWKKAAEPMRNAWAENVRKAGGDPDTVMKELDAALAKFNAAAK
jgi:TRAP-type C4-dicarboxylate transport system substrate-binding protein